MSNSPTRPQIHDGRPGGNTLLIYPDLHARPILRRAGIPFAMGGLQKAQQILAEAAALQCVPCLQNEIIPCKPGDMRNSAWTGNISEDTVTEAVQPALGKRR